jgi:hypothetical protein
MFLETQPGFYPHVKILPARVNRKSRENQNSLARFTRLYIVDATNLLHIRALLPKLCVGSVKECL